MYSHFHFVNLANVITVLGLCSGIGAGLLAIEGLFYWAILLYILAGIFDLLDGPVARRSKRSKEIEEFGSHLDPLVDAGIQGIIPTIFFFSAGLHAWYEIVALLAFSTATIWRLSYFESFRMIKTDDGNYFYGFPTYTILFTMPLLFLVYYWDREIFQWISSPLLFLEAILMVSPIRVFKPSPKPVLFVFFLIILAYIALPLNFIIHHKHFFE